MRVSDAQELYEVVIENQDYLAAFLPWARGVYTYDMAFGNLSEHEKNGKLSTIFGIYENNKLIGRISHERCDAVRKVTEIGYWMTQKASGKGYMTQACQRLVEYIFTLTHYETILIRADISNVASRRIPEKLGFELLDISEYGAYESDRGFIDMARYILKKKKYEHTNKN